MFCRNFKNWEPFNQNFWKFWKGNQMEQKFFKECFENLGMPHEVAFCSVCCRNFKKCEREFLVWWIALLETQSH